MVLVFGSVIIGYGDLANGAGPKPIEITLIVIGALLPERTPDGRYIIVDGRRWRASDPGLSEERRGELVHELMSARRAVGAATRDGNEEPSVLPAIASTRPRWGLASAARRGGNIRAPECLLSRRVQWWIPCGRARQADISFKSVRWWVGVG
jgi:hypothetical protein